MRYTLAVLALVLSVGGAKGAELPTVSLDKYTDLFMLTTRLTPTVFKFKDVTETDYVGLANEACKVWQALESDGGVKAVLAYFTTIYDPAGQNEIKAKYSEFTSFIEFVSVERTLLTEHIPEVTARSLLGNVFSTDQYVRSSFLDPQRSLKTIATAGKEACQIAERPAPSLVLASTAKWHLIYGGLVLILINVVSGAATLGVDAPVVVYSVIVGSSMMELGGNF